MFYKLIIQIIIGILGLWLAVTYVSGVYFAGPIFPKLELDFSYIFSTLVFVGALLGFLNFFVKPILNTITLPLRIITLNLFSLIIAMALVWLVDIFSLELTIKGIAPLFWTTLIIWGLSLILSAKKNIFSR